MKIATEATLKLALALGIGLLPTNSFAIIDGIAVTLNDPIAQSTVAFITDSKTDDWDPSFCTGSLIAPDVVVTAAHCMKVFTRAEWRITFALNAKPKTAPFVPVTDYDIPPEFKPGYAGAKPIPKDNFDIAVLYFKGGLPDGYHVAELLPPIYVFQPNTQIMTAGYGLYNRPNFSRPYDRWNWGG